MRNKILIFFASLLSFITMEGQSRFGISAGGNLTFTSIDHDQSLLAYYGGAFARFDLTEKVFLQPEIQYTKKGTGFPGYFGPFSMEIDFHYISLPVLVGFRLTDFLSIELGPEVDYLVDGEVTIDKYGPTTEEDFPSLELSLDLGAQYQFGDRFGIRLRYSHGLTNAMDVSFFDANSLPLGGLFDSKNRILQFGVYYFLRSGFTGVEQ